MNLDTNTVTTVHVCGGSSGTGTGTGTGTGGTPGTTAGGTPTPGKPGAGTPIGSKNTTVSQCKAAAKAFTG